MAIKLNSSPTNNKETAILPGKQKCKKKNALIHIFEKKHSKTDYKESVYFAALRINTVSNHFYYILLHSNTLILQVVLHSNIFFVQSVLHSKNVGNIIHAVSYILKPVFYYLYIDIPPSYDNWYNSEFFKSLNLRKEGAQYLGFMTPCCIFIRWPNSIWTFHSVELKLNKTSNMFNHAIGLKICGLKQL